MTAPLKRLIVPAEPTAKMLLSATRKTNAPVPMIEAWYETLATGKVTREMLEGAARALVDADPSIGPDLPDWQMSIHIDTRMPDVLAVVRALDLEVEG